MVKRTDNIGLGKVVELLIGTGIIAGHLAHGSSKYMGICRLDDKHNAHRIDVMTIDETSWPYATLYFTGSKDLNVIMRSKALELGYSMNECGMVDQKGINYEAKTEKDIFDKLGMAYLKPHERSIGSK